MIDFGTVEIGGITLIALVFGLVEFLKATFGLTGKPVTILSAFLGGLFMALYQALPMLPEAFQPWAQLVVVSVAFGLAASGFYKYGQTRLSK